MLNKSCCWLQPKKNELMNCEDELNRLKNKHLNEIDEFRHCYMWMLKWYLKATVCLARLLSFMLLLSWFHPFTAHLVSSDESSEIFMHYGNGIVVVTRLSLEGFIDHETWWGREKLLAKHSCDLIHFLLPAIDWSTVMMSLIKLD